LLRAALAGAIAGHGRVVLVCGEPGIGKTRLAEELAAYAAGQGAGVCWGRCREGAGAPAFWPWIQILRAQFAATDAADLRAQLGTGADEIGRLVPDLHEHLGVPAVPLADDEGARFRLFDSVVRFLRASAAGQALVLILEDLHWAQPASVELLRFLIDEMQETRLLVVATYRDIEVSGAHPLTAVLQSPSYPPQVQRVALAGLSEEEIGQLIAALGHESSAALVTRIHRGSGGNPFFAAEIVRGLGTAEAGIPGNVRDAISHRLRRLSEGCRRLLGIASVIGPEFEFATLERVAAELGDGGSSLQLVSEAQGARIVVEIPGAVGRGYRFAHALIRDVLYTALPLEERLHLHWHVATALEALGGPDRERTASVLAHHFSEAVVGCADGELRQACIDKAVQYAIQAAEQATVMCAYEEAVARYEEALHSLERWAAHDRRRQCELLLAMGETQVRAWAKPAVRSETFRRAAELARQLREPQFLARAAIGLFTRVSVLGAAHAADTHVAVLREALEAVGPHDSSVRARLLGCLALATHFSDPHSHRVALSEEAVAVARRVGDPRMLWSVLLSRWTTLTEPGQAEERMALATEIIQLGKQLGDTEAVMFGRNFRFLEALEQGQVSTVQHELAVYTRLADDLRQPGLRSRAVAMRAALALLDGRFSEAEHLVLEVLQLARLHHPEDPVLSMPYFMQLSVLYWEQDRYGELKDFVKGAVEQFPFIPGVRAALAHVYAEAGRVDEARAEIERLSRDDLRAMPHATSSPILMWELTHALAIVGDTTHAATLYALLLPYARQLMVDKDAPICLGSGSLLLGLLAHLMGRWDDALRHLDDALAAHERIRSRPWIANTQWAMAAALLGRNGPGDRERAAALLAEVLETTDQLGMRRLQRQALALRGQMNADRAVGITNAETRAAPDTASERLSATFRREGEYWVISYKAPVFRLKGRMGLRYLALLLKNPGREFLAVDLVAAIQGGRGGSIPDHGAERVALGGREPYLDQQARREYAQRLRDLHAVVEEAQAFNDRERASRAQAEVDLLTDELRRGIGLGHRVRPAGSPAERARASVTHAIKAALRAITEHDPALGQYLAATIKTGTFCSYSPDPRVAMVWV
jgi:tetratricopeptide (TPR) repeat protein